MRCYSFLILNLALLFAKPLFAQKPTEKGIPGEYMLIGVMETAAGLQLKPDHTFEYGFIYGAADKWGKGGWKAEGKKLILTSDDKQPAADFRLKKSDASSKTGIMITIVDSLGRPYRYVECRLGDEVVTTDDRGEAHFKTIHNGALALYHPIYSLRITQIPLNPKHSAFWISPVGDLSEVYFKDMELYISPDELTSKQLPGMPPQDAAGQRESYTFKKSVKEEKKEEPKKK